MELNDALVITMLGMAVVFSGLFLTAALIISFSVLPRVLRVLGHRAPADGEAIAGSAAAPPDATTVPPHIVAVIAAVLEVERRLYHSDPGGRLTINRRGEAR